MTPTPLPCGFPGPEAAFAAGIAQAGRPGQEWEALVLRLDEVSRQGTPGASWLEALADVQSHARTLAARHLDLALLHAFHAGASRVGRYRSRQALRRMLVAGEVARALGYDAMLLDHLDRAALALDVSPALLEDRLARLLAPRPQEPVRALARRYAEDAQALLLDGTGAEPLWAQAVRQQYDLALETLPPWLLTTAQHLVVLLRRVDLYCMRITRYSGCAPLLATLGASGRCPDAGAPADPVAAALLRAMGLYPPGSCVQLDSGERGIVLARGRLPGQPLLALLSDARGAPLLSPSLCDTAQPGHSVCAMLRPDQMPAQPALEQLHALCEAVSGGA
jgi:hypothetical protein